MIQLYIGEGKGKTTAAVGQAIRALGWGGKVLFSQFLKSIDTGEEFTFAKLDGLKWMRPEMRNKCFIWHMNEQQLNETGEDIQKGFTKISHTILEGNFKLAVLDEILDTIECGFLTEESLFSLLDNAPWTEFVLTGRRASERLKEKADYITIMTKVKHPFDKGLQARKGIEF
jgi:cob(I)alamin adenosyltransferase